MSLKVKSEFSLCYIGTRRRNRAPNRSRLRVWRAVLRFYFLWSKNLVKIAINRQGLVKL